MLFCLMKFWLYFCIQDTLLSRAALGLPAAFRPSASREQKYLAYKLYLGIYAIWELNCLFGVIVFELVLPYIM